MVPEKHICHEIRGSTIVPHYLDPRDHVWIRALQDEYARFVDRPRHELDQRLREPLPCQAPPGKLRLATFVLDRLHGSRVEASIRPARARQLVFERAASGLESATTVLDGAARDLGVTLQELDECLFADIPGERRVAAPATPVGPTEITLQANLLLAQAILFRSSRVIIEAEGHARAVVRHAKFTGLLCTVVPRSAGPGQDRLARQWASGSNTALDISGPFSLFRRTLIYGRALAGLVPHLGWCTRYRLRAECHLRGMRLHFELRTGDPIQPAREPAVYDSRLEERFARDFRKVAPGFDVIREPEAVTAGATLIFPDFALIDRCAPGRRWLVEIVGFWTSEYLVRKLQQLRAARLHNLIVCIDEDRNCGENDLPSATPVVRYRRRIDPEAVLQVIRGKTPSSCSPCP